MRQLLLAVSCLLFYATIVWPCHAQFQQERPDVPHVSECNYCQKCRVTTTPKPWSSRHIRALELQAKRETFRRNMQLPNWMRQYKELRISHSPFIFMPVNQMHKHDKPNCTECHGCNTELMPMHLNQSFLGHTFYKFETGAAQNWVFKATTNKTRSGLAAVKIFCISMPKRGIKPYSCWPLQVALRMQLVLAQERLRQDCGFEDIVPAAWLDPVNAVMPGSGYHIHWYALWMDLAPGISFEGLVRNAAEPRVPRPLLAEFLNARLNTSQVPLAALFDLLTLQCDRHQQNVLLDETGNLHLIDNEVMFKAVWPKCAFDSMLLPTSSKYQASHLGYSYVLKQGNGTAQPTRSSVAVHPALLLDYRCWAPGGKIGRQLPPKLSTCLAAIRDMSVQQVMEHHGLLDEEVAGYLKTRATDLYERGFEYTLFRGLPRNLSPMSFKLQPPCCHLKAEAGSLRCAHSYQPHLELPFGDTNTGGVWKKHFPDPGSYDGSQAVAEIPV